MFVDICHLPCRDTTRYPWHPMSFLSFLTGGSAARAEKRRLEAFFSALPLDYCGWSASGAFVYSRGFASLLGVTRLQTIHDIENALSPSDAAALEGMFLALTKQGESFSLRVHTADDNRILRLSGARGQDAGKADTFHILWLLDETEHAHELEDVKNDLQSVAAERDKRRMMLHAIPMPVWISDSIGDIAWVNAAYAKAVGKDYDDIVEAQIWLPVTLPGSTEEPVQVMKSLVTAARTENTKKTLRARLIIGGQRRMAELAFLPVENTDLVMVIGSDVTVEEERIAEQKRYIAAQGTLLEQLHTAVAIFSADHKLEFHNAAFARLWGVQESWLNEHPKMGDVMEKLRELRRLPEQADFRAFKKSWLDMFTGLLHPHEDMLYLPNGTAVRMLVSPHPMGGLMMTFEDVTSRLALESSYNTLMAVQRETLENLAEGVAVFGSDGRLKLYNSQFMHLWNLNPEDLQGNPHVTQLAEKQRKFFGIGWQDVEAVLTAQGLQRQEQTHQLHRDDDTVLECFSVPLPDGGVMVTHRDITDKTRVENALREKALALEESDKLKKDFLANVSYQLRTPLNAMNGFAEILANNYFGELNPKQSEYTKGILEAGDRLVSLIDDILDLSTIEAGYMSLHFEDVNVKDLLQDVYDLTREWAGRETLTATLKCPDNIGTIRADERRLKQILINLIRNSISFTPGGGTITIHAEGSKENIRIAVADSGIGIKADDQATIFAPFQRANPTDAHGAPSGPGLGLSLVNNIVKLHGGNVDLTSRPGEGTTVTLTLPRKGPAN